MIKMSDLIDIEISLVLQLTLLKGIEENKDLKEDEILEILERIRNLSKEIEEKVTILLNQKSENKK